MITASDDTTNFPTTLAIADMTVAMTDNDPGVVISQSGGTTAVTEGGATDTYTVVLATQPGNDVIVSVTPTTQVGATPASLTFTTANWNTPQTVTVTAVNDTVYESNHSGSVAHAITTGDGADYLTTATLDNVTINITDNDRAPSNNGGSTSSGSVVLPSTLQVTVSLSGTGSGRVASNPAGIDCQKESGICQASFSTSAKVTLTVTADENSELSGFGGHTDCGDGSLLLLGNRQCTVFFTKKPATPPPDNGDNGSGNHHSMIPVYRLYSNTWKGHFYTTNAIEKDRTLSYQQDWRDEDVAYYVYDTADHPDNTHPVYRLWSHVWQSHLYTMNELEMKRLVTDFPDQWRYEGMAYYAYKKDEQPTNTIPVYRFYSFGNQSHFYTINENEKNVLLTHPASEWRYEEVAWYVPVLTSY